jgi:hypothetical protein
MEIIAKFQSYLPFMWHHYGDQTVIIQSRQKGERQDIGIEIEHGATKMEGNPKIS